MKRNNHYLVKRKIVFHQYVDIWKEQWANQHLTQASQEEYLYLIRLRAYPEIENLRLMRITTQHIQNIIHTMEKEGKAAKTIKKTYTAINSVFRYAYKMELIAENPCLRCELPRNKTKKEICYLTDLQARKFLNYVQENETLAWQAFFFLAIYGGFRRGELVGLTWNNVDFQKNTITIEKAVAKVQHGQVIKDPKTYAAERTLILPPVCVKVLESWFQEQQKIKPSSYVFTSSRSANMLNVQIPTHKFKQILNQYNHSCDVNERLPDICLHDLRHTNATLLIAEGVDIETISHRMGHAQTSVTLDIYGHALPDKDRYAAEVLEKILR